MYIQTNIHIYIHTYTYTYNIFHCLRGQWYHCRDGPSRSYIIDVYFYAYLDSNVYFYTYLHMYVYVILF
jgi:hypothetical protein